MKKKRQRLQVVAQPQKCVLDKFESDILEKINYNAMIEDFISRNTRRMILFGRS
jgi:hypothetical protein